MFVYYPRTEVSHDLLHYIAFLSFAVSEKKLFSFLAFAGVDLIYEWEGSFVV